MMLPYTYPSEISIPNWNRLETEKLFDIEI